MKIEISTEQLSGDISAMQNCLERLENAKTNMFSCIEQLNGMWMGSAHDAFVIQTRNDTQQIEELLENLQEMIACMEYAKTEYENCAASVEDKSASIQIYSGD